MAGSGRSPEPAIDILWPTPDVAQVVLTGEHDLNSAPELVKSLAEALDGSHHLIVDLSDADFIDSSTISALVTAKKNADESGARFNLVLASTPIVERVLEITGVLTTLHRVKTLEQALDTQ